MSGDHAQRLERLEAYAARLQSMADELAEAAADLRRESAAEIVPAAPRSVSVTQIKSAVAKEHGLPPTHLVSQSRRQANVAARHDAIYLARMLTGQSLPALARQFHRDHSTIAQAVEKIRSQHLDGQRSDLDRLAQELKSEARG